MRQVMPRGANGAFYLISSHPLGEEGSANFRKKYKEAELIVVGKVINLYLHNKKMTGSSTPLPPIDTLLAYLRK
jgi:hypothetical protein